MCIAALTDGRFFRSSQACRITIMGSRVQSSLFLLVAVLAPAAAFVATAPRHSVKAVPIVRRMEVPHQVALDGPLGLAGWTLLAAYQVASKRFTAAWASQNAEARAV